MSNPEFAIIGAGPAGLAAGYEAVNKGGRVAVLEREGQVGGLSKTLIYKGYGFDIGGHRFFTKLSEVNRLWEKIMPDDFLLRDRLSRIYYHGRFFRYPLRLGDAMYGLGIGQGLQILGSFLKAQVTPNRIEKSFEDWVSNRFGHALYSLFFQSYTEKVWGIPCNQLSADWAAQRIKDLDFTRAALNAIGFYRNRESATLAETFHYPRLGPGQMYDRMASEITQAGSSILQNHQVMELIHEHGKVKAVVAKTDDGQSEIPAENFISSMGLDELIGCMRPKPPTEILTAAAGLKYRGIMTANLIVDQPSISRDNWIYLHAPEIRAARMQLYKNWSSDLVPDDQTSSVGLEFFASEGDSFWSLSDEEVLKVAREDLSRLDLVKSAQAKDGCVVRYAKAYPIYDVDYAKRLKIIRQYLDEFSNFLCIGRSGQFRYNNMDHSIYTGLLAVRKFAGQNVDPWDVNVDEDYLESPS